MAGAFRAGLRTSVAAVPVERMAECTAGRCVLADHPVVRVATAAVATAAAADWAAMAVEGVAMAAVVEVITEAAALHRSALRIRSCAADVDD
jgi:hypothetical protein